MFFRDKNQLKVTLQLTNYLCKGHVDQFRHFELKQGQTNAETW